jgi:uncharacterized membrane protein
MTTRTAPTRWDLTVRSEPSFRLGARGRKTFLLVHIVSAGVWVGLDVAMGVLVFTSLRTDNPAVRATSYQALELFAVWPIVIAGMLCLASGVVLGLGTKYGLIRYWWVALKLVLNIVLTALVLVLLRPGLVELAARGRAMAAGEAVATQLGDMIFPPIVSTLALIVAMALSVYKPWGRIRAGRS